MRGTLDTTQPTAARALLDGRAEGMPWPCDGCSPSKTLSSRCARCSARSRRIDERDVEPSSRRCGSNTAPGDQLHRGRTGAIKGKWKIGERMFAETLPALTFLVMGTATTPQQQVISDSPARSAASAG